MLKEVVGHTKDGKEMIAYTLTNKNGMKAKIMNYGCNLLELWVPDKNGKIDDVVLGYENIEDYFVNGPGFGACIGPVANRIGEAKFTLGGKEYHLEVNDGKNNLHTGATAMQRQLWKTISEDDTSVKFSYKKADGELGLPGNLTVTITYTLSDDNAIRLDYEATSDADTLFNPTNHTYFNLSGHNSGSASDHIVCLTCSKFTPADNESIPHGEVASVAGTTMDFTTPKKIDDNRDESFNQIVYGGGYDHNWIIDEPSLTKPFGYLYDEKSGRKMEMYTTLPGVQFYEGNFIGDSHIGKGGQNYHKRSGVCFESQYYPNAINVSSDWPKPILKAGETTKSSTIYKFV